MSSDPIGKALRADAEAARDEIRAKGISCPSCGVNLADLPEGHALAITDVIAECRHGAVASLAYSSPMSDEEFATWQNAANIALYDDFRRRETEAFSRMIGI